ncbi:Asp23/Gls24 family envelope stress response protein [Streptomyces sp. 8L]|uniref:Asp23/Gls24 family envelope stress response protein n=1 Tax=unclassified Streptomyces TaxID=2593676 RepID=UPI001CD21F83|nr:Asp23/Gls24 family envelope stress response protein [Streptomyces sp. 8L]MCA1222267.1 Asp23/Gls24 family envelope stress response protein [Streptomyces sp. 8L]
MTTVHTAADPDDVTPGRRGSTTIADRVVAKIAAQAAREALFHGVPEGGDAPHAVVTVHKNHARVRIGVELDYPSDIGAQCGAVRLRVAERVNHLAGMTVPEVRVHVERLHSAASREAAGRPR